MAPRFVGGSCRPPSYPKATARLVPQNHRDLRPQTPPYEGPGSRLGKTFQDGATAIEGLKRKRTLRPMWRAPPPRPDMAGAFSPSAHGARMRRRRLKSGGMEAPFISGT